MEAGKVMALLLAAAGALASGTTMSHDLAGTESFIPAASPSCWYTGRTQINLDGSRSFDWEGTQLWVNVQGASYVKMVITACMPCVMWR